MTFKKRTNQNSMINANSACTRMWVQGFKVNVKQKAEFEWLEQVGQAGGMEVKKTFKMRRSQSIQIQLALEYGCKDSS